MVDSPAGRSIGCGHEGLKRAPLGSAEAPADSSNELAGTFETGTGNVGEGD